MSQSAEAIPSKVEVSRSAERSRSRYIVWVIVGLVLLLIIVWLGVGAVAADLLTRPIRDFNPANNPGKYGMAYENVTFEAQDGEAEIAAWYIPSFENDRAVVLVHGRHASRSAAFKDRFPELAAALNDAGFSVLMIDLRGHGESSSGRFSFGIKERNDVLGAVSWLKERGYESGKIGVLGVSLGAAASVGAAAEDPAIGALVTDSGFAEIYPIIKDRWQVESRLPMVFMYSTLLMHRLMFGYHLPDSRPVEEIGDLSSRGVMLIHCKTDNQIPYSHMEQLEASAASADSWLIPECDHAEGYVVVKDEYDLSVSQFFDQELR